VTVQLDHILAQCMRNGGFSLVTSEPSAVFRAWRCQQDQKVSGHISV